MTDASLRELEAAVGPEEAVRVQARVEALYTSGGSAGIDGRVVAYTEEPTYTIEDDDGQMHTWIVRLCRLVPAERETERVLASISVCRRLSTDGVDVPAGHVKTLLAAYERLQRDAEQVSEDPEPTEQVQQHSQWADKAAGALLVSEHHVGNRAHAADLAEVVIDEVQPLIRKAVMEGVVKDLERHGYHTAAQRMRALTNLEQP